MIPLYELFLKRFPNVQTLAKSTPDELTEDHWKALNYLRSYYLENGICPMIRRLVKETGFTLKKLYDLFPYGPANSACKWAGVPKATGCV